MYAPCQRGGFVQPDPIGYADLPNLYNYVLGDPVNYVDPLGLSGCDATDPTADCFYIPVTGIRPAVSPSRLRFQQAMRTGALIVGAIAGQLSSREGTFCC